MIRIKKTFLLLLIFVLAFSLSASFNQAAAQEMIGGCSSEGQCVGNQTCVRRQYPGMPDGQYVVTPEGGACGSAQLGGVALPNSVQKYNGYGAEVGILSFLSRLLNFFAIICGIWTMFNFLYSGWLLVSAQSDTKAQQEVKERLTMTAIGLVIIASAYMGAGIIGLVFFKDASFILNPVFRSALDG